MTPAQLEHLTTLVVENARLMASAHPVDDVELHLFSGAQRSVLVLHCAGQTVQWRESPQSLQYAVIDLTRAADDAAPLVVSTCGDRVPAVLERLSAAMSNAGPLATRMRSVTKRPRS